MTMTFDYNVEKNDDLGIYQATFTITLPPITVTRYQGDKGNFRYDIRRAVEEIVGEVVEKALDD